MIAHRTLFAAAFVLAAACSTAARADCAGGLGEFADAQHRAAEATRALNEFLDAHMAARDFCVGGGPALHKALGDALLSSWAIGMATKKQCEGEDAATQGAIDKAIAQVQSSQTSQQNAGSIFAGCTQ